MTLIELKQAVDNALLREGSGSIIVCIPNNIPSMGGISVTEVMYASRGIDWDNDKFIIRPSQEMINKPTIK